MTPQTTFLRGLTLPRSAGILKLSAMFALVVLSTQSFAQSSSVNPPIIRLLCLMQIDYPVAVAGPIAQPQEYFVSESDGWKITETTFSRERNGEPSAADAHSHRGQCLSSGIGDICKCSFKINTRQLQFTSPRFF